MKNLAGKYCVVTGAGKGIGRIDCLVNNASTSLMGNPGQTIYASGGVTCS